MLLAAPLRAPALRRTAPEVAVLAAVTSLVLAGAAHLLPAAAVVALTVGAGATLAGVRLTRLAVRTPAARDPHVRDTDAVAGASTSDAAAAAGVTGARRPSTRRAVLLLDAAVVVAGLATAVLPLLAPEHRMAAAAGPVVVATFAVLGMAGLTALTGVHRRSGAATCRGGVALTLLGMVLLAVVDTVAGAEWPALVAVPPLVVVGMLLVAAGAARLLAAEPAAVAPAPAGWSAPTPSGPATAVSAPVAPPVAGLADGPALLRALTVLGGRPTPTGALLVVELHLPDRDTASLALRADVLAEAVRRASAVVDRRDLLAQVSEAGFAVVTEAGPMLAYALGDRLLAALTQPYRLGGAVLRVPASIGLAEVGGESPQDVLRQADLARRRAVQLGRDRVEWYDAFLEEQLVRRLDLERELPGAVARGELDLVYQPVLRLGDRRPVGTEAFLRWRSPVLGTVLPDELFPVATDLGIVGELEWWVLDRACRQLAEWTANSRQLWMAVNVTTGELTTPDFVQRTTAVLAAYGVPPEQLVVEVAEPRIGVELSTVVARLAGLRSAGVRTALDDFRAEHASLAQLRRLPIDLLKVGAPLVDPTPDTQRPLIDVVVNVGDRLGVEVVAEELESAAQVQGARRAGCRYGQGFALARPATAERVEAYFEEFPSTSR